MMNNIDFNYSTDHKISIKNILNYACISKKGSIISIGEDMNTKEFVIDSVEKNGIKLVFNQPLCINYRFEDGIYFASGLLDIEDYGESLEEMVENYKDNIITCWRIYVEKEDGKLTRKARHFGKELKKLMRRE